MAVPEGDKIRKRQNWSELEEAEFHVLAYMAHCPKKAKDLIDRIGIKSSFFSNSVRAGLFDELYKSPETNAEDRIYIIVERLVEANKESKEKVFVTKEEEDAWAKGLLSVFEDWVEFESGVALAFRKFLDLWHKCVGPKIAADTIAEISRMSSPPENISEIISKKMAEHEAIVKNAANILMWAAEDEKSDDEGSGDDGGEDSEWIELLDMPGFVNTYARFISKTAVRPNKIAAFTGALAFFSHLSSRRFIGPGDIMPSIYIALNGPSGIGKDQPRKANKEVLRRASKGAFKDAIFTTIDKTASGEGLEDKLEEHPVLLCQFDEWQDMLKTMAEHEKKDTVASGSLLDVVLRVNSASNTTYITRVKAKNKNGKESKAIPFPGMTIFATTTIKKFYTNITDDMLSEGMLGRFYVFDTLKYSKINTTATLLRTELDGRLTETVNTLLGMLPPPNDLSAPNLIYVPFAGGDNGDAKKRADAIVEDAGELREKNKLDDTQAAMWSRAYERVIKLALLRALSREICKPEITVDDLDWAWKVVKTMIRKLFEMVEMYMADSEHEKKKKSALAIIKKAGRKGILRKDLKPRLHADKKMMDLIEVDLVEDELLKVVSDPVAPNGTTPKRYIYAGKRTKKTATGISRKKANENSEEEGDEE